MSNFPGRLNGDFWTGLVNPDLIKCESSLECLNHVHVLSDGSPYDTEVYPDHTLKFNNNQFCARYFNWTSTAGINDQLCSKTYYFACEFSCHMKSEKREEAQFVGKSCNFITIILYRYGRSMSRLRRILKIQRHQHQSWRNDRIVCSGGAKLPGKSWLSWQNIK